MGWCLLFSWKSSKFYTVVRVLAEISSPILVIVVAFIGRNLLNLLAGQTDTQRPEMMVLVLIIVIFFISAIRAFIQKLTQYCQSMHEDILDGKLSLIIMERALSMDLEYYDNPAYYDKFTSVERDSRAIMYVVWSAISCVSSMISFIGIFIVLFQANFLYSFIMTVAAIPSSVVAAGYTKQLYRVSLEQINGQRQMDYCRSIATERLYAQDLRLFQTGEKLKNRYRRIWEALFTKRRRVVRRRTILMGILECLPEIVIALISIDLALNVLSGAASIGDYSLYTGLVTQLWAMIMLLSSSAMNIYDNKMQLANFKTLDTFHNHVATGSKTLEHVETIEFEQVCFTYPQAKSPALQDVSFLFHKDQKVALVGVNGSGKSTLIKLLLRMYNPDSGVIRINGIDSRLYSLTSLRSNFSVYFQDMLNFSFSLRDNFIFSVNENDDECASNDQAIKGAMQAAGCDDILCKVESLDVGITRFFEQDGIEVSGGQHQKLALARAFYRFHTALILDEPSSNLDPKAEHEVFEYLKVFTEGKMTIFTSHRLSNVFLANRIIVLENGRIIEDGTQKELLQNKNKYAELFKYQQEKYSER